MEPLISVIVPVYQVSAYLNQCIESILAQHHRRLEVILVDDGSTDGSASICDQYAQLDTRIIVLHKQNGGLSDARNAGIERSTGEYLAFVDGDDYIAPEMYQRMLTCLIQEKADLCVSGIAYVDSTGNACPDCKPIQLKDEVLTSFEALERLVADVYYVVACNKLYSRSLFDQLRYPVGRCHEDEFLIHHIYGRCQKIMCMKETFYHYVQRENSIMNAAFSIRRLDAAWAFYDRYLFCKQKGFNDLAYISLRQAYGNILLCMQKLPLRENRQAFHKIMVKVLAALKLNGRSAKLLLTCLIKTAHEAAAQFKFQMTFSAKYFSVRHSNKFAILLMATPTHGNLGDHAIVYAEKAFFKRKGMEKQLLEIRSCDYLRYGDYIQSKVDVQDWIIIDGGGNLGTLWTNEDDKIRDIVTRFSKNLIRIFPQTCYYADSKPSEQRLEANRLAYATADHLVVMLRDQSSYDYFSAHFPTISCELLPDIVLSLHERQKIARSGVLLCFRSDHEKVTSSEIVDTLCKTLSDASIAHQNISTVVDRSVSSKSRNTELKKIWTEFSSAKLVVTDRLHAMIFAAITSTPCIAVDNQSKKVSGAYAWLKENPCIFFEENLQQLAEQSLKQLQAQDSISTFEYPFTKLSQFFYADGH